jgi:hypothetical protein
MNLAMEKPRAAARNSIVAPAARMRAGRRFQLGNARRSAGDLRGTPLFPRRPFLRIAILTPCPIA